MKPTFSGLPAIGYTLTTSFVATLSGNAAFRLDSSARESTVTSSVSYTAKKQLSFPLESNIWTKLDHYNLVGDIHFMKYPQDTYGLGSQTKASNGYGIDFTYWRFYTTLLKTVAPDFYVGLGYDLDYFFNVEEINPPAGGTDFAYPSE